MCWCSKISPSSSVQVHILVLVSWDHTLCNIYVQHPQEKSTVIHDRSNQRVVPITHPRSGNWKSQQGNSYRHTRSRWRSRPRIIIYTRKVWLKIWQLLRLHRPRVVLIINFDIFIWVWKNYEYSRIVISLNKVFCDILFLASSRPPLDPDDVKALNLKDIQWISPSTRTIAFTAKWHCTP